jgi:hypothetical protein
MDPKVVKLLHDAFEKGLMEKSHLDTLAKLNQEPFYLSSRDYYEFSIKQMIDQKTFLRELELKPK